MTDCLPDGLSEGVQNRQNSLLSEGFPKELAVLLALTPKLKSATDMIFMSDNEKDYSLKNVVTTYFLISEYFGFNWLLQKAEHIESDDRWNEQAKTSQIEQLNRIHATLCEKILADLKTTKNIKRDNIEDWAEQRHQITQKILTMITQFKRSGSFDLAMLTLASNALQSICDT